MLDSSCCYSEDVGGTWSFHVTSDSGEAQRDIDMIDMSGKSVGSEKLSRASYRWDTVERQSKHRLDMIACCLPTSSHRLQDINSIIMVAAAKSEWV